MLWMIGNENSVSRIIVDVHGEMFRAIFICYWLLEETLK